MGGLPGNPIGDGREKTLATVACAVDGAYAGSELQKNVSEKKIQLLKVKTNDE